MIASNFYVFTHALHICSCILSYNYNHFPGLSNQEEFSFITEEELNKPMKKVRSLNYNVG